VFTRTKHLAGRLADQLARDGIAASAIHGNKTQGQRIKALDDFKEGRIAILVATEVAARGLDIDGLPHVVNFELPTVPEDYIHRIGRTGRAGLEGDAISLVCIDELELLNDIESLLKRRIPDEIVPGFELDPRVRAEPIRELRRGGRARQTSNRPVGATARPHRNRNGRSSGQPRPASGQGRHVSAQRTASRPRPDTMPRPETTQRPAATPDRAATPWSSFTVLPGERIARAGASDA